MWGDTKDFFLASPTWRIMCKMGISGKKNIAASKTATMNK